MTWCVVGHLGRGGYGNVDLWRNNETGEHIAIKSVLHPERHHPYQWHQEAQTMKRLNHPNVVRSITVPREILRLFYGYKAPPIGLEYCDLGNLRKFLSKTGAVRETNLRTLVHDLCSGLSYLHKMKIVHRDLKPDNILLSRRSRTQIVFKISDFGCMKDVEKSSRAGTIIGTREYEAPEMGRQGRYFGYYVGYLVDYWSLGLTVCESSLGFFPFPRSNISRDILRKEDSIFALKATSFRTMLPKELKLTEEFRISLSHWLQMMLKLEPQDRDPKIFHPRTSLTRMIDYLAGKSPHEFQTVHKKLNKFCIREAAHATVSSSDWVALLSMKRNQYK